MDGKKRDGKAEAHGERDQELDREMRARTEGWESKRRMEGPTEGWEQKTAKEGCTVAHRDIEGKGKVAEQSNGEPDRVIGGERETWRG